MNYLPVEQFNSAVIGKGLMNQDVNYDQMVIKEVKGKKPYRQAVMEADGETVKHLVEIESLVGVVRESGKATARMEDDKVVGYEWEWENIPMKVVAGIPSQA